MIDTSKGFTLTRLLDATPEQIWTAWTDPDHAAQWWHPRGLTTPRDSVQIDARVGGSYSYTMVDDATGEEHPTGGTYSEVVAPERLVFTWGDPGDGGIAEITVRIEPVGDLTRLTFELRGVDGTSGDDGVYDGWDSALDELATHLGQTAVHG
jgi:uncharacterized protein YndB with AHSA1/START domain